MITTSELVTLLYNFLKASALKDAINGDIYKRDTRPMDSGKQDVIINSLAATNDQLETALLNVNVHVPDLRISINGQPQTVANTMVLEQLEVIACQVLHEAVVKKDGQTITFGVQQVNAFKDEASPQHYINIRVQFYITNI